MIIGYTSGVFDMFHIGHLKILQQAKSQCDYLIVGVTTDELCLLNKNKLPVIPERDRMEIVESIKYVDKVIPQKNMNKFEVVKQYKINKVFVGSDWKGTESWNKYEQQFATIGCSVVYFDHTEGISSTILRERLNARF